MKALSICQPYPELILTGRKLVENRTWRSNYRGELLIHAGLSREHLRLARGPESETRDTRYDIRLADMTFGAIVGRVQLVACLHIDDIKRGAHDARFPWIRDHEHATGPWCWVLEQAQRLPKPVPCRGLLGIFELHLPQLESAA